MNRPKSDCFLPQMLLTNIFRLLEIVWQPSVFHRITQAGRVHHVPLLTKHCQVRPLSGSYHWKTLFSLLLSFECHSKDNLLPDFPLFIRSNFKWPFPTPLLLEHSNFKWPLPTPLLLEHWLNKLTVHSASPLTFVDVLPPLEMPVFCLCCFLGSTRHLNVCLLTGALCSPT